MFVCVGVEWVTQVNICQEICQVWFGYEFSAAAPRATVGPGVLGDKA